MTVNFISKVDLPLHTVLHNPHVIRMCGRVDCIVQKLYNLYSLQHHYQIYTLL